MKPNQDSRSLSAHTQAHRFRPTATAIWCLIAGAAALALSSSPVLGQALQDGDIVVGANGYDQFGNFRGHIYRVRGEQVDVLFPCAVEPTYLLIDQQGRVVFTAPACGSNNNSTALYRGNPETGQVELLACFPYIAQAGNIPEGLPQEAQGFYGLRGLHNTRSLRISIDDDVDGGRPQVSIVEAYGVATMVARSGQLRPVAFRYLIDSARFEPGVSLQLLNAQGQVPTFATNGRLTYYANGWQIGRAEPNVNLGLNLRTSVFGAPVALQAALSIAGRNELIHNGEVLDNTTIPNITVDCGELTDENVPLPPPGNGFVVLDGISSIGFLGGGLYATTNSGAAGHPYLFNLAARGLFLNPFNCQFYGCSEHYGPHNFFTEVPALSYTYPDGGRLVGGDGVADAGGRLVAVTTTGWDTLASGLTNPRGAAVYPPPTPPITSVAIVIRVDSGDDSAGEGPPPANVLLTDAAGRRIGRVANGTAFNDFGDGGVIQDLGPQGQIAIMAVIDPAPGAYSLDVWGTADGSYVVRGYMGDTSTGGSRVLSSGRTRAGLRQTIAGNLTLPIDLTLGPPICHADFNADGAANSQDFFDFLAAFFAAGPNADFNSDGAVNSQDFFDFLGEFFAGCP